VSDDVFEQISPVRVVFAKEFVSPEGTRVRIGIRRIIQPLIRRVKCRWLLADR
jgi:hypothetical protein